MYVYANTDGRVANTATGGNVMLRPGEAWFADDPFVQSRLDLFSATPTIVHSTVGRTPVPATPVVPVEPAKAAKKAIRG